MDAEGRHGLADVQPVWPAPSLPRPAVTVPSVCVERDVNRVLPGSVGEAPCGPPGTGRRDWFCDPKGFAFLTRGYPGLKI